MIINIIYKLGTSGREKENQAGLHNTHTAAQIDQIFVIEIKIVLPCQINYS